MTKYLSKSTILFLALVILSGCASVKDDFSDRGFEKILVKGGGFWITTFQKVTDKHQQYVFYIEGDGAAFSRNGRVSTNPTPRDSTVMKLAALDRRPNIVYVARPCQYTPSKLNKKCGDSSYWSSKRLSKDSLIALNQVINNINNNKKFNLIGYSGGGGMAILIAAGNPMVKNIITIAANLDHIAFTDHHNVTPMSESLNPIDYARQVKHISQLHIAGAKDTIIPPFIVNKFVQSANSKCVKYKIIPDVSHHKGWIENWPTIVKTPINFCN